MVVAGAKKYNSTVPFLLMAHRDRGEKALVGIAVVMIEVCKC